MVTYNDIKHDEEINTYIKAADASLLALGYTEHSFAHVGRVSEVAAEILETLGFDARAVELARIAGYLHDIGNLVNRADHSQSGAVMAFRLLEKRGMSPADIADVVTAIGNHDEGTGKPVSPLAAALILADKSDVRRTRVRNGDMSGFDIHDRVNYSVVNSTLKASRADRRIRVELTIDTSISSVSDYFEIFLGRMILCRKAAEALNAKFELIINNQQLM